jgi:hypothetical protein
MTDRPRNADAISLRGVPLAVEAPTNDYALIYDEVTGTYVHKAVTIGAGGVMPGGTGVVYVTAGSPAAVALGALLTLSGSVLNVTPTPTFNSVGFSVGNTTMQAVAASPEGVVTAPPGSVALQTDGTIWRKASGVGNTGWTTLPLTPFTPVDSATIEWSGSTASLKANLGSHASETTGIWRFGAVELGAATYATTGLIRTTGSNTPIIATKTAGSNLQVLRVDTSLNIILGEASNSGWSNMFLDLHSGSTLYVRTGGTNRVTLTAAHLKLHDHPLLLDNAAGTGTLPAVGRIRAQETETIIAGKNGGTDMPILSTTAGGNIHLGSQSTTGYTFVDSNAYVYLRSFVGGGSIFFQVDGTNTRLTINASSATFTVPVQSGTVGGLGWPTTGLFRAPSYAASASNGNILVMRNQAGSGDMPILRMNEFQYLTVGDSASTIHTYLDSNALTWIRVGNGAGRIIEQFAGTVVTDTYQTKKVFWTDLFFGNAVATPTLSQEALTTDVAPAAMTFSAQSAWVSATGANKNGGELILSSGAKPAGETNYAFNGKLRFQLGGNTIAYFSYSSVATSAGLSVDSVLTDFSIGATRVGGTNMIVGSNGGSVFLDANAVYFRGGSPLGAAFTFGVNPVGVSTMQYSDGVTGAYINQATKAAQGTLNAAGAAGAGMFLTAQTGQAGNGSGNGGAGGALSLSSGIGGAGGGGGGVAGAAGAISFYTGSSIRLTLNPTTASVFTQPADGTGLSWSSGSGLATQRIANTDQFQIYSNATVNLFNIGPQASVNYEGLSIYTDATNSYAAFGVLASTYTSTRLTVKGKGATSATSAFVARNSALTVLFDVKDDGTISTLGAATLPYVRLGVVGAYGWPTTGLIRTASGQADAGNMAVLVARNYAGTGDLYLIQTNSSNSMYIGNATIAGLIFDQTNAIYFRHTGVNKALLTINSWDLYVSQTFSEALAAPSITQIARASDVAPATMLIQAQSAWASAVTNINGGTLQLFAGDPVGAGFRGIVQLRGNTIYADTASLQIRDASGSGLAYQLIPAPTGTSQLLVNGTVTSFMLNYAPGTGAGGGLHINGQNAGGTNNNGGQVFIATGTKTGSGADGYLRLSSRTNVTYSVSSAFMFYDGTENLAFYLTPVAAGATTLTIASTVTSFSLLFAAAAANGAAMNITGQAGGGATGVGGSVNLTAGVGAGNGGGGNMIINSGAKAGSGGDGYIYLNARSEAIYLKGANYQFRDTTDTLAMTLIPASAGTSYLQAASTVTAFNVTQSAPVGTGTAIGAALTIQAQAGQAQTGANNNNKGGNVVIASGSPGTGGSGSTAIPGDIVFNGGGVQFGYFRYGTDNSVTFTSALAYYMQQMTGSGFMIFRALTGGMYFDAPSLTLRDGSATTTMSVSLASSGPVVFAAAANVTQYQFSQTQKAGTGASAGAPIVFQAQAGQNQTGGANNNNGGSVSIAGGAAGTGGSGTAGVAGSVNIMNGAATTAVFSPTTFTLYGSSLVLQNAAASLFPAVSGYIRSPHGVTILTVRNSGNTGDTDTIWTTAGSLVIGSDTNSYGLIYYKTSATHEFQLNGGMAVQITSSGGNKLRLGSGVPLEFISSNTTSTIRQEALSGTGATAGGTIAIEAQAGQAQSGANNNNNGGDVIVRAGAAGTGGSGTAGVAGTVYFYAGATARMWIQANGLTIINQPASGQGLSLQSGAAAVYLRLAGGSSEIMQWGSATNTTKKFALGPTALSDYGGLGIYTNLGTDTNVNVTFGVDPGTYTSAKVTIKGLGATNATSALVVRNSSATILFEVKDDGAISGGSWVASSGDFNYIRLGTSTWPTSGLIRVAPPSTAANREVIRAFANDGTTEMGLLSWTTGNSIIIGANSALTGANTVPDVATYVTNAIYGVVNGNLVYAADATGFSIGSSLPIKFNGAATTGDIRGSTNFSIYGVASGVSNFHMVGISSGVTFQLGGNNVNVTAHNWVTGSASTIGIGGSSSDWFKVTSTGVAVGGSTAAATGAVRIKHAEHLKHRNNAGGGDLSIFYTAGGADHQYFGDAASGQSTVFNGGNAFNLRVAGSDIIIGQAALVSINQKVALANNSVEWASAASAPKISQVARSAPSAQTYSMTIEAQENTGSLGTGGDVTLKGGIALAFSSFGNVILQGRKTIFKYANATDVLTVDGVDGTVTWAAAVVNPVLSQLQDGTNGITGDTLTIRAQNATGTTTTGGALELRSGTGTTIAGEVRIYAGSTLSAAFAAAAISMTSATLQFVLGVASPTIKQADVTAASSTGSVLLIQAQNATGATSTGGALELRSGTGTTAAGVVKTFIGSTEKFSVYSDHLKVFAGGSTVAASGDIRVATPTGAYRTILAADAAIGASDLVLLGIDNSDNLYVGTTSSATLQAAQTYLAGATQIELVIGSSGKLKLTSSVNELGNATLRFAANVTGATITQAAKVGSTADNLVIHAQDTNSGSGGSLYLEPGNNGSTSAAVILRYVSGNYYYFYDGPTESILYGQRWGTPNSNFVLQAEGDGINVLIRASGFDAGTLGGHVIVDTGEGDGVENTGMFIVNCGGTQRLRIAGDGFSNETVMSGDWWYTKSLLPLQGFTPRRGYTVIAPPNSSTTLSSTQYCNGIIRLNTGGGIAATQNLVFPAANSDTSSAQSAVWKVDNQCGQSIVCKTPAQVGGVTIASGQCKDVYHDGTNIVLGEF